MEVDQSIIKEPHDLYILVENLNNSLELNNKLMNSLTSDLIDLDFINQIKRIYKHETASIYFGKTLRDLKIVVEDEDGLRGHEIFLQYKAPRKLIISNMDLPPAALQNREYESLEEVIETITKHINDLSRYFYELDSIDRVCEVMEPDEPSYKDCFRKIRLDNRTWLHVEVTPAGSARNIHLVGNAPHWYAKLQSGLAMWDLDLDIVDNILTIFDISSFQQAPLSNQNNEDNRCLENVLECAICLCGEIPGTYSMPQPLCQNTVCGVYYHKNCLYQWLVACAGNRPPALGIANGECPRCHQPITCSENDN